MDASAFDYTHQGESVHAGHVSVPVKGQRLDYLEHVWHKGDGFTVEISPPTVSRTSREDRR